MGEVVLLSLTASLNPTLLAATTLMLLLERPKRLMFGYLLGAYLASISLGLVIVFSLSNSSATKTTRNTLSPAADIALGSLALIAAFVLQTGWHEHLAARRRSGQGEDGEKRPPRWRRELSKGSPRATFVLGALLTLPGASYLAGLVQMHKLDYPTAGTVALVVGFNVVMLWLLEVPLLCFAVAPDRTPGAIERAKAWVGRHALRFAVTGLAVIGALLVVKGVVGLLT